MVRSLFEKSNSSSFTSSMKLIGELIRDSSLRDPTHSSLGQIFEKFQFVASWKIDVNF